MIFGRKSADDLNGNKTQISKMACDDEMMEKVSGGIDGWNETEPWGENVTEASWGDSGGGVPLY